MTEGASGDSALVLFSGGQDSTTCLAWALKRFERVETVGFDYGQRHRIELEGRAGLRAGLARIDPAWAGRLGEEHTIGLAALGQISDTALTRETAIEMGASGLPNTFVPGRNIVFLTFAAALVELIREESHSCYLGERGRRHDWGHGCGDCPACHLRAAGWERYRREG